MRKRRREKRGKKRNGGEVSRKKRGSKEGGRGKVRREKRGSTSVEVVGSPLLIDSRSLDTEK